MYSLDELEDGLRPHRQKKIILTGGVFDLFHIGHVRFLKECKALGDILVVTILGDKETTRRKGSRRPIVPEDQRAEIVESLKFVDFVFIFPTHPYNLEMLLRVNPNVLVFGNQKTKELFFSLTKESDLVSKLPGLEIKEIYLPRITGTTEIEEKIQLSHR